MNRNKIAISGRGVSQYWLVNLETIVSIKDVRVFGREDCCFDVLDGLEVDILDHEMNLVATQATVGKHPLFLNFYFDNVDGSYVRLRAKNDQLALAEVQVMADESKATEYNPVSNLALHKTTDQLTTLYGRGSDLAVDGDLATATFTNKGRAHWMVDLQLSAYITHIYVYNRIDCCRENL